MLIDAVEMERLVARWRVQAAGLRDLEAIGQAAAFTVAANATTGVTPRVRTPWGASNARVRIPPLMATAVHAASSTVRQSRGRT